MAAKRPRDNVTSPSPFGVPLVAEAGLRRAIIVLYMSACGSVAQQVHVASALDGDSQSDTNIFRKRKLTHYV